MGTNTEQILTIENLERAIELQKTEEVITLLRQGVLVQLPLQEQSEAAHKLMALRDMKIANILASKPQIFSPDILRLDFTNWKNRDFVRQVLEKHRKKFNLDQENVCKELFVLSCETESVEMVRYFLRKKKNSIDYAAFAIASDRIFQLYTLLKPEDLTDETCCELIYHAAISKKGISRIELLKNAGFRLDSCDANGKTAADKLAQKISENKYSKNRAGECNKKQDRQVLQMLNHPEKRKSAVSQQTPKKWILPCGAAVVLILCGILFAVYSQTSTVETSSDTSAETTQEEVFATESSSEEASVSYATDSSLTVADGDTVNIDYTGYVDDVAFDGGSTNGSGTDLTIGSGSYIDDFEEQLIGHQVGETVEVNVTFPENYGVEELNGKEARFNVTINGIYEE